MKTTKHKRNHLAYTRLNYSEPFYGVHFCQEMQFWQNLNVLSEYVDIEGMFNPNKGDHLIWILSLSYILFCLFY